MSVSITLVIPSSAPAGLIDRACELVDELAKAPGVDEAFVEVVRTCFVCGCTDDEACLGGCWWAELLENGDMRDVCSSCAKVTPDLSDPAVHQGTWPAG